MANTTRHRTTSSAASTTSNLLQDVPGAYPRRRSGEEPASSNYVSLSQAIHARRAEYVRPKEVRIKVGSWNVASYKGTEKDVGGWFVGGKGITEALTGLTVRDQDDLHQEIPERSGLESKEEVGEQEARYKRKHSTIPKDDPGSLPGGADIGLYVLGLQEVVDVNSFTEALRPSSDPSVAKKWKDAMIQALPEGYVLVAEQQLIGMLLIIFASPAVAKDVKSVSTTSVGTGIAGYMGNKGAVTARIVLGETTRMVFINSHMSAGADEPSLERRNRDASQIVSRTRFEPISDSMDLNQTTGEQIGDEDFAFWCGDLNYRLTGVPGDDVRRILMLHTRDQYDLSQPSAEKVENELSQAISSVQRRLEKQSNDGSAESSAPHSPIAASTKARTSTESGRSTKSTAPTTLVDEVAASEDPMSLQATLNSLLPHDELHQQMKARKAFYDGWQEGPITFLPTYKYDAGSVGVFDSSEKKRAPSWCDRILYRTRRDRLGYEAKVRDEANAKKKDQDMTASGLDEAANDEEILYDYDPETDGNDPNDDYDEYNDAEDGSIVTREGFEDEIQLEYYTAHQRVLSSDHKPLDAVFHLRYDAVIPDLKAKVHAEVAKELDKTENETRPSITVVVDKHREGEVDRADNDPANFEGVWFGDIRFAKGHHRTLTLANTGRVEASFEFIERPVTAATRSPGIAPKWINLKLNDESFASSSTQTDRVTLHPGESCVVELDVRILDVRIVHDLNQGLVDLDDILVLRVEGGRDHFIPVRGSWNPSSISRSIDLLTRIPEGGIRKLQGQKPEGGRREKGSSDSGKGSRTRRFSEHLGLPDLGLPKSTSPRSVSPEDGEGNGGDLPVRFSAPRELFKLTEAVDALVGRVIAEWEMTHPVHAEEAGPTRSSAELMATPAPWVEYPAWPLDKACWTERTTLQFQDAVGDACDALDEDRPLEASLSPELPKMQKLYVLAQVLLLFLQSMPDGIITAELWAQINTYLSELDKAKRKPDPDDERTAIQEILSSAPSHSISFILITSTLERIVQEIGTATPVPAEISSPVTKTGGTFRRIATLGKGGMVPVPKEESGAAMARVLAGVVIRAENEETLGEKQRAALERRKVRVLEMFLRKDEPG